MAQKPEGIVSRDIRDWKSRTPEKLEIWRAIEYECYFDPEGPEPRRAGVPRRLGFTVYHIPMQILGKFRNRSEYGIYKLVESN